MKEERALELIAASLATLDDNERFTQDDVILENVILLGVESPLDSIEFVGFVTDLEERISVEADKDLYLVVNEIEQFNINELNLTAATLAKHIIKLVDES